jgi:predicted NAD/FAD-binding protein
MRARMNVGTSVVSVERVAGGYDVVTQTGDRFRCDEVVMACHADRSLALLAQASPEHRRVLGAFQFRDNEAVLHRDRTLMPRARGAWASWVYACGGGAHLARQVSVTYWMNRLQGLPGEPLFVSLNPDLPIAEHCAIDRHIFRHPVFSREAVAAQDRILDIQGRDGLWFCGAWQRHGFHEDGLWSAVRIADLKGVAVPWR